MPDSIRFSNRPFYPTFAPPSARARSPCWKATSSRSSGAAWRTDNPNNGGDQDDDAAEQIRTAEFADSYGYQRHRMVVTPIPGKDAQPHVQTDLGYAPGSLSVSGSVSSKKLAKAKAWATKKTKDTSGPRRHRLLLAESCHHRAHRLCR